MTREGVGMSIEAICWDWNGTLLDDAEICRGTMNRVLAERGLPVLHTAEEYRRSFRFPIRDFYRAVGIEDADFVAAADRYLELLAVAVADAPLQDGAREVLALLRERGLIQVLASATLPGPLHAQLQPHGITAAFDAVLSISDAYDASKAEVIAHWLSETGLSPEQVLMIGDTNHDHEIATGLGTRFVHFESGHQHLDADVPRVAALGEIPGIIERESRPRR